LSPPTEPVTPFVPPQPEQLFALCFERAYHFGRRWDEALWRFHELRAILRLLDDQPELRQGPILDVGCGDGEVFGWLFGAGTDAQGVDSGAARLTDIALARRAACYREVRCEDAGRTSFADGSFRLVFSNSVLEHIAPIEPVLREVARVLQPGGHFLFTTPDPVLYSEDAYAWRRLLRPLGLDQLGQALARKECDVYHHVTILSGEQWRAKLAEVGLHEVARITYFARETARATSLFSGASRLPALRALVEGLSPLARELSNPDDDQTAWIARCRRVLGRFLDEQPGLTGCGQLFVARRTA
jgi:SAM-dependent methyltransferase